MLTGKQQMASAHGRFLSRTDTCEACGVCCGAGWECLAHRSSGSTCFAASVLARPKDVYGRDHAVMSTRTFCFRHARHDAVVHAAVLHLQAHHVAEEIWRLQVQRYLKQALPLQSSVQPSCASGPGGAFSGPACSATSMHSFKELQNRVPIDGLLVRMMTAGDGVKVAPTSPATDAPPAATVNISPGSFLKKDEHTIYRVTAHWTGVSGVPIY